MADSCVNVYSGFWNLLHEARDLLFGEDFHPIATPIVVFRGTNINWQELRKLARLTCLDETEKYKEHMSGLCGDNYIESPLTCIRGRYFVNRARKEMYIRASGVRDITHYGEQKPRTEGRTFIVQGCHDIREPQALF